MWKVLSDIWPWLMLAGFVLILGFVRGWWTRQFWRRVKRAWKESGGAT